MIITCLSSCDDDDPPLPDNVANFESDQLGIDSEESSATIHINLTREAPSATEITLTSVLAGLTYDTDFTTEPAMNGSSLVVLIPAGATQVSFNIVKKEGIVLDGDESATFTISNVSGGLVIGDRPRIVISFSEIVANQATIDPNVGGALQPSKVFIDLSANRQTVVNRSDWDLGFYTEDGEFRAILNASSSMMARLIDTDDLNSVTATDTAGWGVQLSTDAVFAAITTDPVPAWTSDASKWIDAPSGDMSTTAIAEISATDSDNKVYIVNRGKNADGSPRGWKKVRILRSATGYTIEHADIGATTFSTIEVTNDDDYLFNYINFETGPVGIEPEKDKWDIAFTVFTNTTPVGPGLVVPYVFNDVVIQNRYSTETAELLIADAGTYDEFDAADLAAVTFSSSQINIGAKWRSGGGPGSGPALREDRFYLVKDSDDNVYKLKFTALSQNGERGRPQIQFALIQEGL
jgi:hypothetical protein